MGSAVSSFFNIGLLFCPFPILFGRGCFWWLFLRQEAFRAGGPLVRRHSLPVGGGRQALCPLLPHRDGPSGSSCSSILCKVMEGGLVCLSSGDCSPLSFGRSRFSLHHVAVFLSWTFFPIVHSTLLPSVVVCNSAWSRQASRQRRRLPGPSPLPLRWQVAPP